MSGDLGRRRWWLARLRASVDSTGLLPWRDVAVGEHWFVDVDAFHEICWPSGALRFVGENGEPLVTPVDERLGRNLDGTFRVELRAIEKVAGVRYASMHLRGILESRATFCYEWSIDAGSGLTVAYEGPIALDLYASLEGWLSWNLDGSHLDAIRIEGEVSARQALGEAGWGALGTVFRGGQYGAGVWTGELRADAVFEPL